jgi:hypothetical protein
MFQSSISLMAEDVTVRCRVRKLSLDINNGDSNIKSRKSGDQSTIIEMTCTMRNWDVDGFGSRNGRTQRNKKLHQQPSSRNLSLRNVFSLSNPEISMNMSTSQSKLYLSDSAIDVHSKENAEDVAYCGPELYFTPTYDISPSKSSRVSLRSRQISPLSMQPYSVPVEDIILVTYSISNNSNGNGRSSNRTTTFVTPSNTKLNITTISMGQYDIDCITANGHDIVLAFLQASLSPERIVREKPVTSPKVNGSHHVPTGNSNKSTLNDNDDKIQSELSTNSSVTSSCYDIDALQAKHLAGRAEAETWYEKLQRRVGHIISNVSEQFTNGTFCDDCCNSTVQHQNQHPTSPVGGARNMSYTNEKIATNSIQLKSKRSSSNAIFNGCFVNELEIDDNETDSSIRYSPARYYPNQQQQHTTKTSKSHPLLPPTHNNESIRKQSIVNGTSLKHQQHQQQQIRIAHMPSGLSVEPDPYDLESVR